jgi:uncharacterized protein YbjT (DUF2867 family)
MSRTAWLFGATGLVGGHLLARLLERTEWDAVVLIGRRHPDVHHPKLTLIDAQLDALDSLVELPSPQDVFCCLGTTIKQAGSRQAFAKVDLEYCLAAAMLAEQSGAQRFLMVSAVNANARGLSFYARTKGQAEQKIAALDLPRVVFMQPSLLQGERHEFRPGEEIGLKAIGLVMPLVRRSQASWLPIEAEVVADAMVAAALDATSSGVSRLRYKQMMDLARILRGGM